MGQKAKDITKKEYEFAASICKKNRWSYDEHFEQNIIRVLRAEIDSGWGRNDFLLSEEIVMHMDKDVFPTCKCLILLVGIYLRKQLCDDLSDNGCGRHSPSLIKMLRKN